jgi:hypothetical protein
LNLLAAPVFLQFLPRISSIYFAFYAYKRLA